VPATPCWRGQVETLERLLFAVNEPGTQWDRRGFAAAIAGARKTWLSRQAHATSFSSALPALNP